MFLYSAENNRVVGPCHLKNSKMLHETLLVESANGESCDVPGEHVTFRGNDATSRASGSSVPLYDPFAGEPAEETPVVKHQTGVAKVALHLSKANIGSGILFLPRAFEHGGYLVATLLMATFAIISGMSSLRLLSARKHVGSVSYGEVMEVATGTIRGRYAVDASIVLLQFGIIISYFIFVSKQLKSVWLTDWEPASLILLEFVCITPLCWARQVARLAYPSLIADIIAMSCLSAVVAYNFTQVKDIQLASCNSFVDTFICIGTMCFAFEGVGLLIPIYDSLREEKKFPTVFSTVYSLLFVLYMTIGLGGAAAYAKAPGSSTYGTKPIILNNLKDDTFGKTIQIAYSIAIMCTAPLMWLPAIRIIELPVFGPPVSDPPFKRQALKSAYRTAVMSLVALVAWIGYNRVDNVISMVGAFCGTPLVFVYPCVAHSAFSTSWKDKLINNAIIALGIFILVTATSVNIWAIVTGKA